MKIHIMSDLHLEFYGDTGRKDINPVEADVLILAGDITVKSRVYWVNMMAKHYKHIVYVLGNHEYYKGSIERVERQTRNALADNVHLLQDDYVTLNGHRFVGCTLWTDYDSANPLTMHTANNSMNDHRLIRYDEYSRRFTAEAALNIHKKSIRYLQETAKECDIIVTHHAPSALSIASDFYNDPLNGAYKSDLDLFIEDRKPKLWIHGHMHNSSDYVIGDCRVVCNPAGYLGQNKEFNKELIIEL